MVCKISDREMDHYRAPFRDVEAREPLCRCPNEFPIAGEPEDVFNAAQKYLAWPLASEVLKQLL